MMVRARWIAAVLGIAVILAACGPTASSSNAPASAGPTSGAGPTATVTNAPSSTPPAPSAGPERPWIAYEWFWDRSPKDVMLVRADGTDSHPVAQDIETGEYHAVVDWSPDGQTIAFVVGDFYEGTSIWTVGVDGSGAAMLLGPSDDCSLGVNWPAYSRDGKRLLYVCDDGEFGVGEGIAGILKVLDLATGTSSTVARVVEPEELLNPRWSRDGKIAVVEIRQWDQASGEQVGSQIATVPIAGGEFTRLTDSELWAADPDWNPTQDLIVFGTYPLEVKDMSKPSTIYTMRPDGSELLAITDGTVDGRTRITTPRWTPDGKRLLVSIAVGSGQSINDVKIAFLDLDGTITRLGDLSGVAARMQPVVD